MCASNLFMGYKFPCTKQDSIKWCEMTYGLLKISDGKTLRNYQEWEFWCRVYSVLSTSANFFIFASRKKMARFTNRNEQEIENLLKERHTKSTKKEAKHSENVPRVICQEKGMEVEFEKRFFCVFSPVVSFVTSFIIKHSFTDLHGICHVLLTLDHHGLGSTKHDVSHGNSQ